MKNRMAVRAIVIGHLFQLPVEWTSHDGMCFLDVRHFGPLSGALLREANSFWEDAQVRLFLNWTGIFLSLKF